MSETAPPAPPSWLHSRSVWTTLGVALLLALYLVMAVGATLNKGPSYDEEEELAVGYNIWVNHDFRMEGADGDLIKRWATLPYLISHPHPASTENDYWLNAKPYRFGFEFFFQSGNEPEWLLLQGRVMAALLGAATGFLIFCCAKELFGALGGFFSLILFVFSPHMLAMGGLVSTDMSACFTLLGATWSVWRLLHRVTWGRLALGMGFVSLLMLSKPSGLVIFPITFLLILLKLFSRKPLEWRWGRPRDISNPFAQIGIFAGLFLIHGLCAWTALWVHYDFRFAASPNPTDSAITFTVHRNTDPVDPMVAAFMDWTHQEHLLPEGYLLGMKTLLTSNERREAFMNGQWRIGGWNSFFFHTLWDKTSPTLFILIITGLAGWWLARHLRKHSPAPPGSELLPSFYHGAPYFILAAVYFTIAVLQQVDIGHRHILPVYPALYILGGGPMALVWRQARQLTRILAALLLAGFVGESLWLFPNYLAYFSPLVGGPAHGYEHLVDSSLDWGMDLPGVKKWLDQNNPKDRDPVFLAYFGTDSPEYQGIKSNRLPGNPDWRPAEAYPYGPGIYIISATLFESDYTSTFGPWNTEYEEHYQNALHNVLAYETARKDPTTLAALLNAHPQQFWDDEYSWFESLRFGRLCAWLRHHRPTPEANVGYSILIWRLNVGELQDALLGPPSEIDDSPLR